MYESPIEIYIQEAIKGYEEQRDNKICQYITEKFNVDVDREELIKALKYDRHQYEKGYRDAKIEYKQKIQEMIEEIDNVYIGYRHAYEVAHEYTNIIHKYCDKEQNNETT